MPLLPSIQDAICAMRMCRTERIHDHALRLSAYMSRSGMELHLSLHNCLALMLLDVGCVSHAQCLLDQSGRWDNYLWNATAAGYAKTGDPQRAFDIYEARKDHPTLHPTSYTFVALLKSCIMTKNIEIGHKLHSDIAKLGLLEHDVFISSTLIAMYIKFGLLVRAEDVFSKLLVRNTVIWTALMDGYVDVGCNREVLSCLEKMQQDGISLDAHTYVSALKACANAKIAGKGRELHSGAIKMGFVDEDIFIGSILLDVYLKCGMIAEAQKVFNDLSVKDVVSWTTLIMGYADYGYAEEAFGSVKEMQQQGFSPNARTFVPILNAYGSIGIAARGHEVYCNIVLLGLEAELVIINGLIDMFIKCGSLTEAQAIFNNSPSKDVVSWTTLITGYAQLGEVEMLFHTFYGMIQEGVKPDVLTFRIILNACSHAGVVETAQAYFLAISSHYNLPSLHHYNCMVDALGRAGHINEAVGIVEMMPFHPGIVIWLSVLGACRKWGDFKTGKHAFEHALNLDDTDVGAYVCMSNLFTDALMPKEAISVEAL